MNESWIYPLFILGGALQSRGAAMNAQLFQSLGNKWLANAVSFALIPAFFVCVFAMFPHPLPTGEIISKMLANDGRTVYAATRSTGQIEEGPAGFSVTTLDDGVVSWKRAGVAQ